MYILPRKHFIFYLCVNLGAYAAWLAVVIHRVMIGGNSIPGLTFCLVYLIGSILFILTKSEVVNRCISIVVIILTCIWLILL